MCPRLFDVGAENFLQEVEGVNAARGFPIVLLRAEAETKQQGDARMVFLR